MAGSIIVFSGLDGAGKSTQIELLCQRLARAGRPVSRCWSRGGYTPGMLLLKQLLRRGPFGRRLPPPGPSPQRTRVFTNPHLRNWWLRLAILDLIWFYGLWLRGLRILGRTVICDRYLPDTELDFQLNFPHANVTRWWLWKTLVCVTPPPDCAFLLLIPLPESQRRLQEKQEPFPETPAGLQARHTHYQNWADSHNWYLLDGLRPPQDLADEVEQAVRSHSSRTIAVC